MKVIVKYNNRKLYDTETSKYVNLQELLKLPLGSFKVFEKATNTDITVDTLLAAVAFNDSEVPEVKVAVMLHCINVLSV